MSVSILQHTQNNRLNRLDFASAMKIAARQAKIMDDYKRNAITPHLRSGEVTDDEVARAIASVPVHFMTNTAFAVGPIALTTTLTTNIFNPGTTIGGVNCTSAPYDKLYAILTHLRVVNKTAGAVTVSLWIGATGGNAAGTEFAWQAYSVPANSYDNWYGRKRMAQANFLVGGAGTTTALSLDLEGEIGIGS